MTGIQASKILLSLTMPEIKRLKRLISDTIENFNFSSSRRKEIKDLIDLIFNNQAKILNRLIVETYKKEYLKTVQKFSDYVPSIQYTAVLKLAEDTIRQYTLAIEKSKKFIDEIFVQSMQDIISESRLSEIAIDELMKQGTYKNVEKEIVSNFKKYGSTEKTKIRKLSNVEIRERLNRAKKNLIEKGTLPKYLKSRTLKEAFENLKKGKFISIIGRTGKVRTYSLEYYSSLIARTRVADSQVAAVIDAGRDHKVELYLVSSHNTETEVCKQYEGKFLSFDRSLIGKKFNGVDILPLNTKTKPIYHPNCKHRLLAYPITEEERASIR